VCVDVVAEVFHIVVEVFVEILGGGIEGNQDTNIHLICDALGAEPLKVLAHSSIGLSKLVGFV